MQSTTLALLDELYESVGEHDREHILEIAARVEQLETVEKENEDLRYDLNEAKADLETHEHDATLANEAIEQAFQSALDVERGIYTLGEHLGQLNALRHGAWADRVPVSSRNGTISA